MRKTKEFQALQAVVTRCMDNGFRVNPSTESQLMKSYVELSREYRKSLDNKAEVIELLLRKKEKSTNERFKRRARRA